MKTTIINEKSTLPYPNAATRRQIANKVLDLLLMAAVGAGIAAMLLFLLALAQRLILPVQGSQAFDQQILVVVHGSRAHGNDEFSNAAGDDNSCLTAQLLFHP